MESTKPLSYYEEKNKVNTLTRLAMRLNNAISDQQQQLEGNLELYRLSNQNFDEMIEILNHFKGQHNLSEIEKEQIELAVTVADSIREQTNNNFFNDNVTLEDRKKLIDSMNSSFQGIYLSTGYINNRTRTGKIEQKDILNQIQRINEHTQFMKEFIDKNGLKITEEVENKKNIVKELETKYRTEIEARKEQERLEAERKAELKKEEERKFREANKARRESYISGLEDSFKGKTNSFGDIFKDADGKTLNQYEVSRLLKNHKFDHLSLSEIPIEKLDVVNNALRLSHFTFPRTIETTVMLNKIEEKRKDYNYNRNEEFQLNELMVKFSEPSQEEANKDIENFLKLKTKKDPQNNMKNIFK